MEISMTTIGMRRMSSMSDSSPVSGEVPRRGGGGHELKDCLLLFAYQEAFPLVLATQMPKGELVRMAEPNPEWAIFIPLVASLAGAGLGAWTAQFIAARNKRNDERMKEVRAAHAAMTIAHGITDFFASMKEQIVKPSVDDFAVRRQLFIQALAKPTPPGTPVIVYKAPLDAFRFNMTPYEELQDIVLKELLAPMRPSMIVPILSRTIAMLELLASDRNAMVRSFNEIQMSGKEMNAFAYFGIPFPAGGADTRFADTLRHISEYTDDAIKFGKMIGDDLGAYAHALRQTLPKAMQPLAPRIITMSLRNPELMPVAEKYNSYEELYRPIRVLGADMWTAKFEALALSQYDSGQEHWVS